MAMSMSPLWIQDCSTNITIVTQADIDNLRLSRLEICYNNITITGAEGTLVFDNFTQANGLYVQDSPDLEALSFPDLFTLSALSATNVPTLSNISFPELQSVGLLPYGSGGWEVPPPYFGSEDRNLIDVVINNAPALKTFDFGLLTGFFSLEITGADSLAQPDPVGYYESVISNINSSYTLSLDGCYDLGKLNFAHFVQLVGRPDCNYLLANWYSVFNLTLIDTGASFLDINFPFMINGSLTANSLYLAPDNSSSYPDAFDFVSFIGQNANLTSNTNVDLSLGQIATLGASLTASNNTNCTFGFNKLSEVTGNISITDNPDSIIPWFPDLRRADNIHLRGNIDTSKGPNIFPALTTVAGTVTIEALNSDFNCSQLIRQEQAGIIRNLVCNGTDGTGNDTSQGSSTLSGGPWAGVYVAIGIAAIQSVIAFW
ncbi:hypothetical protein O1611_g55 [Lasiodiplodia mahajangana]|uniref:Uncharacterized protein n=1 Tax=Lasiodiplodia mahajangana TaxID=1108764 RepID=A0ACC2K1A4_9PEZI|nr:hypothetical protein O1611_g55 [Lasiodiplodia mahajangana]